MRRCAALATILVVTGLVAASSAGATALAPFIDLQEAGLTTTDDSVGLRPRQRPEDADGERGGAACASRSSTGRAATGRAPRSAGTAPSRSPTRTSRSVSTGTRSPAR